MLYGKADIQEHILSEVKKFEKEKDIKVIFGAMVGSISKGMGRIDSDYDTRFLYIDKSTKKIAENFGEKLQEKKVHVCSYPGEPSDDLFFDKIAYWEIASFLNYLVNPILDEKESVGLYHIVNWTIRSPFVWDPYGLVSKISPFIDRLFDARKEIDYYMLYIKRCLSREKTLLREYLYSVYYLLSIDWCINKSCFAPVYFPVLLEFCKNEELISAIKDLEQQYQNSVLEVLKDGQIYSRKMGNSIVAVHNPIVDKFISNSVSKIEVLLKNNLIDNSRISYEEKKDAYYGMLKIIEKSLNDPIIKDVND